MRRRLLLGFVIILVVWSALNVAVGWWMLPPMLLNAPLPERTEVQREAIRSRLATDSATWRLIRLKGGDGGDLEVWHLRRAQSRGVVVYLHGFGDDAWGTLPRAEELPEWDAVGFTFRGRDRNPHIPCTLGGWERSDVCAVVRQLECEGIPRSRIVLAGWSQGAGVALLALADMERVGGPLGGALLECPFENLAEAARNHIRLLLGPLEILARPAEWVALHRGGRLAGFSPGDVSPVRASNGLRTPIALVTGDADVETPLEGVVRIARAHPDLTIVPGAGHCQASGRLPQGWRGWAVGRLGAWGFR